MTKGDIVLIPFPFTDLSGMKFRPAVVLIASEDDVTVCFITTQLKWKEVYDIIIEPSIENGLKMQSLIQTNKITTIDKDLVIGKLGCLKGSEIKFLNESLSSILQLND